MRWLLVTGPSGVVDFGCGGRCTKLLDHMLGVASAPDAAGAAAAVATGR